MKRGLALISLRKYGLILVLINLSTFLGRLSEYTILINTLVQILGGFENEGRREINIPKLFDPREHTGKPNSFVSFPQWVTTNSNFENFPGQNHFAL